MATGVASWSTTAASNSTADANVNWAEGQAPSSVNDSARALMASVALYRDDTEGSLTTGGTSTAYTVTSGQSFASLAALSGNKLALRFNATNGASPTLNVDALGAKAIQTASGAAVATGAILADSIHTVTYDNSIPAFLLHDNLKLIDQALTGISITGATELTAPAVADELPIYDASATANRKITLANVLKVINALTAETAPATDDEVALYDTSGATADKITLANLLTVVNALTEDTAPDEAADFLLSYDTSAGAAKKVKPDNIVPKAGNGASLVLIEAIAASGAATVDFNAGLDDTYDEYEIRISGGKVGTDGAEVQLRIGTGVGPTYKSGVSDYSWSGAGNDANAGAAISGADSADSVINLVHNGLGIGNAAGEQFHSVIHFANPDASNFPLFTFKTGYIAADGHPVSWDGSGMYRTAEAITAVRILPSSGTISGTFALYGFKKA